MRQTACLEPSLNSIFINVVGPPPESPELTAPPVVAAKKPKAPSDPRVKKEFRSVLVSVLVLLLFTATTIFGSDPAWYVPIIFLPIVGFSIFKYIRAKREVEGEQTLKGGGPVE